MMPTAQKQSSIINDENLNPNMTINTDKHNESTINHNSSNNSTDSQIKQQNSLSTIKSSLSTIKKLDDNDNDNHISNDFILTSSYHSNGQSSTNNHSINNQSNEQQINQSDSINQTSKILIDLTNNNIVDCLANDSSIRDSALKNILTKDTLIIDSIKDNFKDQNQKTELDSSKDVNKESNKELNKDLKREIKQSNNDVSKDQFKEIKESTNKDLSFRSTLVDSSTIKASSSKEDSISDPNSLSVITTASSSNRDSQISQISQLSQTSNLSSTCSQHTTPDNNQKSKHKKFVTSKNRDSSSSNGSSGALNINKEEIQAKIWKYSKTHQKRFKRRFPSIVEDEQLIDWFSAALIAGQLLLQGYLYISEKHFAFYSNIFGYKTHVIVKISDVKAITKEKTAKIFPNAVGIHTKNDKFVFGSLLSRESTFKLLNEVRSSCLDLNKEKQITTTDQSEDDSLVMLDCSNSSIALIECSSDKKTIKKDSKIHSDDHQEHNNKLDSLQRRQRRSSSLKINTVKEKTTQTTPDNDLNTAKQIKLLNDSNQLFDFNNFQLKNLFRIDLKGSKSSFLISSICFLLFILLVSISILLFRINSAHDKLSKLSMSTHSRSMSIPELNLFNEMFKVIEVMKMNLNEINQLRNRLN